MQLCQQPSESRKHTAAMHSGVVNGYPFAIDPGGTSVLKLLPKVDDAAVHIPAAMDVRMVINSVVLGGA